jgi:hypothetical protein
MLALTETEAASVAVQVGLIFGIAGSLVVVYGALRLLRPSRNRHRSFDRVERQATLVGFLLIAIGFGVRLLVEAGRLFR